MTTPAIPASSLVNVIPGVISAGGTGLDANGLLLTQSDRVPIGTVASFATATDVASYFGPSSQEAGAAAVYFKGYNNSLAKPGSMLVAQYPESAVAAYLRGGNISTLTLTQLQAITPGTLTLTIDGTSHTSSSINLSSATSFSNAASIITSAIAVSGVVCTFDSVSGAFIIASSTTGVSSSVSFGSGAIAAPLLLTQATGAVVSPGADAATPGAFMTGIAEQTQDWVSFWTTWLPAQDDALAFAAWTSNQFPNRYAYLLWDTDASPTTENPATGSLGYLITQNEYSGVAPIWEPTDLNHAAMLAGFIASIAFDQTNARATMAYRTQDGATPAVSSDSIANNLLANGYNFYGRYSTANDAFNFFQDGSISGAFKWIDSYINQIWLNNQLQLALMVLLGQVPSIPYNRAGYALIEAACNDPILAAVNFGAIRAGVTLSSAQVAEVNNAAGASIAGTLQSRGWYLQVKDATPQVRIARGSPPITLWYLDGQSVQKITLSSLEVQ